jgi:TPR repeat protein
MSKPKQVAATSLIQWTPVKLARASRLANRGDVEASYGLGRAYTEGDQGAPQDLNKGARWFRVAAEGGLAEAQARLGTCYVTGYGVAKDYKEAVKLYQLSADQGFAAGQASLAGCYWKGVGVEKNLGRAKRLYYAAAKSGEHPLSSLVASRFSTSCVNRMAHLHACVDHPDFSKALSPENQAEALSGLAAGLAKCDNDACGKTESRAREFKSCFSCKNLVHYCSVECQLEHWPAHSPVCQQVHAWEPGVCLAGEEAENQAK